MNLPIAFDLELTLVAQRVHRIVLIFCVCIKTHHLAFLERNIQISQLLLPTLDCAVGSPVMMMGSCLMACLCNQESVGVA